MGVKKVASIVLMLVIIGMFTANAQALLHLPGSDHYQGTAYRTMETGWGEVDTRVDFAVYDTLGGNEFINAGYDAPGAGRYIYAYQVFNSNFSESSLAEFAIQSPDSMGVDVDSISAQDGGTGGIEPTDAYFNPELTEGVWKFEDDVSGGIIMAGDHSWILVLSSDMDWVKGDYQVKVAPSNDDVPVPEIPEPATIALLGIGSAVLLKNRKSK